MSSTTKHYFSQDFEQSRETFRGHLEKIKKKWPDAELTSTSIGKEQDNTIDMIYSQATGKNENVIFMSSGEHGIEGYAGAASIHVFVDEFLDKIDPENNGICLIHALNPWGMRNFRRVTENNVDLNRNYVYNRSELLEDVNKKYENEEELFVPSHTIKDLKKEKAKLYTDLSKALAREGYSGVKQAKGMGQFEFEKGVYYGGKNVEENTLFLKRVQQDLLGNFQRVIHMDWHTALGPSNEVAMVLPGTDSRDTEEVKDKYGMKNIVRSSTDTIKGDSNNHFYLVKEDYPETYLFSALFEFGTFGEGKKAELRELMTIVFENQLYWEGAEKEEDRQYIMDEFMAMFYPQEEEWQEDVIKEARYAIESLLKGEKVL
ncbi:M14 family metallopeptidase [Virgibacillus kekensis]|uniref:M14 family metallopeptidase n=1 Tax=Virgibacillus kekensis TaxID=202261 RepID=A0ABV9DPK6_9BACI